MNTLNNSELCAVIGGGEFPVGGPPPAPPPPLDNWSLQLLLDQLTRQYDAALRWMMTQGLAD